MATPTLEPTAITAGDSASWSRTLTDTPANSGWALSYAFSNFNSRFVITASASGSDHLVALSAAASAAFAAGDYSWQAYVANGIERRTIATGRMTVRPNLATQAGGLDVRSNARRILDALLVAYEQASISRAFVQEYDVAGRKMRFQNLQEWQIAIQFWQREVAREERSEKIARGIASGNRILVRY